MITEFQRTKLNNLEIAFEGWSQKRCLTAIALISNLLLCHGSREMAFTKNKDGYRDFYAPNVRRMTKRKGRVKMATTWLQQQIRTFWDGAHVSRERINSVRSELEEIGLWKVAATFKGHFDHKSPPSQYQLIDTELCLLAFQRLMAIFESLGNDAQYTRRRQIKMPSHFCSFLRDLFKAVFKISASTIEFFDLEWLNNSEKAREDEALSRKITVARYLRNKLVGAIATLEQLRPRVGDRADIERLRTEVSRLE